MQGQQNSRNWITHYKVAFSLDGRHWSIYKEVGKEKVCCTLKVNYLSYMAPVSTRAKMNLKTQLLKTQLTNSSTTIGHFSLDLLDFGIFWGAGEVLFLKKSLLELLCIIDRQPFVRLAETRSQTQYASSTRH